MDPEAERAFRNIFRMVQMNDLEDHIMMTSLKTADRFFFEASGTLIPALVNACARGLFVETPASGGPHNMVFTLYTGTWGKMRSWRSTDRPSLQMTVTELRTSTRRWVGDADIDLGNPLLDVLGFFTHLVELIVPGKTSHRKLEGAISKRYDSWLARQKENA